MQDLHDRGTGEWIRRPGAVRLTDVPDACPSHLRDDPSFDELMPDDGKPEPGTMQILSPEEYFRLARDQLPAEQWQARGFLVDWEVARPAGTPGRGARRRYPGHGEHRRDPYP